MKRTAKVVTGVAGLTAGLAVVVGLSSLSGCGQEKGLPSADVVSKEAPAVPPTAMVPAASEDAARRVVERAVKATTDGQPGRLDKARVTRTTAKGHFYKTVGTQQRFVETNRVFQAAYPDKVRVDYEFTGEGGRTISIGLRRPAGVWARDTGGESPVQDSPQFADMVAVDAAGTHWMLTLTPLTDPKAVVYGLATRSAGGRPFDTIKASVPSFPVVYTLWFDQATGLLAKVEYANLEGGVLITKVVALSEHKPFGGLTLPTKIDFTRNGQGAENWTVESWEFPDKIDDAAFEQPK